MTNNLHNLEDKANGTVSFYKRLCVLDASCDIPNVDTSETVDRSSITADAT